MDVVSTAHSGRLSRLPVALLLVALVLAALGPAAASAGDPAPFPFVVQKFNCEADPGVIGQAELPEGCVGVPGVAVTVTDSEGTELGSCITGEGGQCIIDIDVPDDAIVFVEEDESTGTAGYSPRENPVEVEIVNEFSEAKLVNIKDEPKLPNTGAGPLRDDRSTLPLALAGIAILLALAAAPIRGIAQRRTP